MPLNNPVSTLDGNAIIHGPRPWIDVTHPAYGADLTGVNDSTTAIQAAVDDDSAT